MKVKYKGSSAGPVIGPGGVRFDKAGDVGEVPDSWGQKMCTTTEFEAVEKPAKGDD